MRGLRETLEDRANDALLIDARSGESATGANILRLSRHLGDLLREAKIEHDATVGALLPTSLGSAAQLLALLLSGRTILPINLNAGPRSNIRSLQKAGAAAIVGGRQSLAAMAGRLGSHGADITLLEIPTRSGRSISGAGSPTSLGHRPSLLLSTSGTTGDPKLVPLTEAELLRGATNVVRSHLLEVSDRAYCVLPVYHINGLVMTILAPIVSGGSSVIARDGFSATRYWSDVGTHQCTWLSVVPAVVAGLLTRPAGPTPPEVRLARSASAPLSLSKHLEFERRFEIPLVETLGMTEASGPVLVHPGDGSERLRGETGRPCSGIDARIVGSDSQTCEVGVTGHLWVRGPSVVKSYWLAPGATATSFSDGWFISGDLAFAGPTGIISVVGRDNELINKGGEKIAPAEIDEVVAAVPGISEAAAFSLPDPFYGSTIGLALVGDGADHGLVREAIRSELGEYMVPSKIVDVAELPRGPSGKILRRKIATTVADEVPGA